MSMDKDFHIVHVSYAAKACADAKVGFSDYDGSTSDKWLKGVTGTKITVTCNQG